MFYPEEIDSYNDEYTTYANGKYMSVRCDVDSIVSSFLKNGFNLMIQYDLEPLIGEMQLKSVVSGGAFSRVYNNYDIAPDNKPVLQDSEMVTSQSGSLDVKIIKYKVGMIALTAAAVLLIALAAVFVLLKKRQAILAVCKSGYSNVDAMTRNFGAKVAMEQKRLQAAGETSSEDNQDERPDADLL